MYLTQLSPQEIAGFLTTSAALGYIFVETIKLTYKKIIRKQATTKKFDKGHEFFITVSATVCAVCALYGSFIEPFQMDVTNVQLHSSKIKSGTVRVVQISDLHSEKVSRLEERLPAIIAAQKPDLIVFTGDALNEKQGLPTFQKCISALALIAPTYAVDGNHDVRQFPNIKIYPGTGVHQLLCQSIEQDVRGSKIVVTGVPVDKEKQIPELVSKLDDANYNILLHHYPATILLLKTPGDEKLEHTKVDLLCVGHTHGGQVCLPFYGAIITHSGTSKKFESGLYKVGKLDLYVNRGIGMDGGLAPRIRFLAKPEITVFDISPNTKP